MVGASNTKLQGIYTCYNQEGFSKSGGYTPMLVDQLFGVAC